MGQASSLQRCLFNLQRTFQTLPASARTIAQIQTDRQAVSFIYLLRFEHVDNWGAYSIPS